MRKAFNLQEALAGKPVVTREGEQVLNVLSFVGTATLVKFPVVFSTEGYIYTCTEEGRQFTENREGNRDLFMEVEDEVVWINFYRGSDWSPYSRSFSTEEAAEASSLTLPYVRIGGKAYKVVLDGGTE